MNASINSLLGPLEAATRQGSWEDAEDIAREISRLARLQRLSELQKIQEALIGRQGYIKLKQPLRCPQIAPGGSQVAKTPLLAGSHMPFHASELLEKLKDPDWTAKAKAAGWSIEELRKTATKTPLPVSGLTPVKQGQSTLIPSALYQKTQLGPFCEEQWPFG